MKRTSGLARAFAAALRAWSRGTARDGASAVRLDIRNPPQWSHLGTANLTPGQARRLTDFMRKDLATQVAASGDETAVAHLVNAHLDDLTAAGRRTICARDLLDIAHHAGRPKEWIATHTEHLTHSGRLRESRWRPGTFRITPPTAAWAVRPGMPKAR